MRRRTVELQQDPSRRGLLTFGLCGVFASAFGRSVHATTAAEGGNHEHLVPTKTIPSRSGFGMQQIGDGLYWITDGAYNTMFAVSVDGVVAFDAPPSLVPYYFQAIRGVTSKPITHLVYSHEHVDHIAGAELFPENITIVANRRTADLLASRQDGRRRVPNLVFDDSYRLSVGQHVFDLSWKGVNHSLDNTFIYAPRQRVLMLVDIIYPGWMPYKNLGLAIDVPGLVEAHRQALAFDFETLVAGHVSRVGTRADVEAQLAFLKDLADCSERAYAELSFTSFLASQEARRTNWEAHNNYETVLIEHVMANVPTHWRCRLQGFDVYFRDNCWTMLETFMVQGAPHFNGFRR